MLLHKSISYYNFADMKDDILCPHCIELGRKPQLLGKYEDVVGRGDIYLWCKKCRREIRINIKDISLDR